MGGCFETKAARLASAEPDPTKHVNYVLGMVLGEDDFKQEFAYLSGRDQWLARDLIGYGTVRGLGVHVDVDGANGPRIYIAPGVALSPRGQLICVPAPQCAHINAWLDKHTTEVGARAGSPPGEVSLYIVLCYRECPTDDVPIPGEPCRTEDQLTKPSRLRDDFILELALDPPKQREEEAVRDFCRWLRQIEVSDPSVPSSPLAEVLNAIREAVAPWFTTPPPASPPGDFAFGSPPGGLSINPADLCDYLRAAFRLWVTELRPKWIGRWYGCAPDLDHAPVIEDCVLLGEIRVPLLPAGSGFLADDRELPTVHQETRPFIVHLRILQEWLLCGACACGPGILTSPPAGGYQTVAAGTFEFEYSRDVEGPAETGTIQPAVNSYNGLVPTSVAYQPGRGFVFSFSGYDSARNYLMKLTPVALAETPSPPARFGPSFFLCLTAPQADAFGVRVVINRPDRAVSGAIMLEVSEVS